MLEKDPAGHGEQTASNGCVAPAPRHTHPQYVRSLSPIRYKMIERKSGCKDRRGEGADGRRDSCFCHGFDGFLSWLRLLCHSMPGERVVCEYACVCKCACLGFGCMHRPCVRGCTALSYQRCRSFQKGRAVQCTQRPLQTGNGTESQYPHPHPPDRCAGVSLYSQKNNHM